MPHSSHNYPLIIIIRALGLVTWENKFHFTDCNQVFTEATIVSNGDPLDSSVFFLIERLQNENEDKTKTHC